MHFYGHLHKYIGALLYNCKVKYVSAKYITLKVNEPQYSEQNPVPILRSY